MRYAVAVLLCGCTTYNIYVGSDGAADAQLAERLPDLARSEVDAATLDLSATPDAMEPERDLAATRDLAPPADLPPMTDIAPSCGGFNQPCCNTGAYPYPSYCTDGLVCLYGNPNNQNDPEHHAQCVAAGDGYNRCGYRPVNCGGYKEKCCTINGQPTTTLGGGFCRINGAPSQCGTNSCVPCNPN